MQNITYETVEDLGSVEKCARGLPGARGLSKDFLV